MRYYAYDEYDPKGGFIQIYSEEDIHIHYYPYWYGEMCKKFGKDHVDATYTFQDCIDDFVIVSWAWEVNDG